MSGWTVQEVSAEDFAKMIAETNAVAFTTLATACGHDLGPSMIVDDRTGIAYVPRLERGK